MKTKKLLTLVFVALVAVLAFVGIASASKVNAAMTQDEIVNSFVKVGDAPGEEGGYIDYVQSIAYGAYDVTAGSGNGVMVTVRNKAHDLVDITDNNNSTNPLLLDLPSTKYPVGVKYNKDVYIADNTASDSLLELAFPGENDNVQVRGIKILIEDSVDPNKHIALFLWSAYGNTDATDGSKASIICGAGGTWEKTKSTSDFVYMSEAGFDYVKDKEEFRAIGSDVNDGYEESLTGSGTPKDGWYLNTEEYGHTKTSIRFDRTSANYIKIQFDYETGLLAVNGVEIRHFRDPQYSADGEHVFDGFTDGKVKLSVGVIRSVRRSTDEFTKFCIVNVDKHYSSVIAPISKTIDGGVTELPKPLQNYTSFNDDEEISSEFKVNIKDPSNVATNDYTQSSFDFDKAGVYELEYFVSEASVGKTYLKVLPKILPSKAAENGSVSVNSGSASGLLQEGENTIALVPSEGCRIKSLKVGGEDVTAQLVEGVYTFTPANLDSHVSYEAEFEAIPKYTVTFVIDGQSTPVADVLEGTLLSALTAPEIPAKVGYDIVGWDLPGTTVINENKTVTAQYAIKKYSVTFMADGQQVSVVENVEHGTLLSAITAPEIPAKVGYDAKGWDLPGTTEITENKTVTAQYEIKKYTVTFVIDGQTAKTVENVEHGTLLSALEAPQIPEKSGYDIIGWDLSSTTVINENKTVTAVYVEHVEPVVTTTEEPAPVVTTTEEPTPVVTTTEAPAPQTTTQAPAPKTTTQAPVTEAPVQPAKKGCKGAIVPSIVGVVLLLGSIVVIKRKREE